MRAITTPRRAALGLFVLAPLVAEFASGNLPISMLWLLLFNLLPLYGGQALLVRELVRRRGGGWPRIVPLALACALAGEAFMTQSLFNPDYAGLSLLDHGYLPGLGIGAWWTLFALTLHVVWSFCVPIAIVEALAGPRWRAQPWLGRRGVALAAGLYGYGFAVTAVVTWFEADRFLASPVQFGVAALLVAALVGAGLRPVRAARGTRPAGAKPPPPLVVGLVAVLAAAGFFVSGGGAGGWAWVAAGTILGLVVAVAGLAWWWARCPGWSERHRLALAGGALLTYVAFSFAPVEMVESSLAVKLAGNAVFAAASVVLLRVAYRRARADPVIHLVPGDFPLTLS